MVDIAHNKSWIKLKDAAVILDVHPQTAWKYVKEGRLEAHRVAGKRAWRTTLEACNRCMGVEQHEQSEQIKQPDLTPEHREAVRNLSRLGF